MKLEVLHQEPPRRIHETPILFVHGAWHAAWCWQENFLPYFCQHGFAAYALSFRGHGQSEGDIHIASIEDYVQDIASTVDGLQAAPVIVGHSMGGLVVQRYLERYHQHPSAVLLAPVPYTVIGTLRMLTPLAIKSPGAFIRFLTKLSLYEFVSTPELARKLFFSASLPQKQVVSYFERLQEESLVFRPSELVGYFPRPERVKTRILVLGAERDGAVPRQDIEATARAYHAEAEFFNTAHDMMLEPGWQQVADRIIEWVDTQDRRPN